MKLCAVLITLLATGACAHGGPQVARGPVGLELDRERERARHLEGELDRLRADLRQAEQSLIALESGLKGLHTRAEAVSALADGRTLLKRATKLAPWRKGSLEEARGMLEEADRHVQAGHFGSAKFFASRAQRISLMLIEGAQAHSGHPGLRYVRDGPAALRSSRSVRSEVLETLDAKTPVIEEAREGHWVRVRTLSGKIGWLHTTQLAER